MKTKERLSKVVFALNAFLFLLSAIGLGEQGKWLLATIQGLAAALNIILLLRFLSMKSRKLLGQAVFIMNVLVCLSVAIDYQSSGSNYIHFAWYLAALISLLAIFINRKKAKPSP